MSRDSSRIRRGIHSQIVGQHTAEPEVRLYRHKKQAATTQEQKEMAGEINALIYATCRRVVLDRVMDNRFDREECEVGEEIYDMCEQRRQASQMQQSRERFLARLDGEDSMEPGREALAATVEDGFEGSQRQQD
jgi:hypothetical protein